MRYVAVGAARMKLLEEETTVIQPLLGDTTPPSDVPNGERGPDPGRAHERSSDDSTA